MSGRLVSTGAYAIEYASSAWWLTDVVDDVRDNRLTELAALGLPESCWTGSGSSSSGAESSMSVLSDVIGEGSIGSNEVEDGRGE